MEPCGTSQKTGKDLNLQVLWPTLSMYKEQYICSHDPSVTTESNTTSYMGEVPVLYITKFSYLHLVQALLGL